MPTPRFRVVSAEVSPTLCRRLSVEVEDDGVARLCVDDRTLMLAASTRELEQTLGLILRPA